MGIHSTRTAKNEPRPTEAVRDRARIIDEDTGKLAAHLESARLRIINTPMGRELIAELTSFEVDFTSAGNMRI